MRIYSSYLSNVYDPNLLEQIVETAVVDFSDLIVKWGIQALAFRGNSGAALAFPLSLRLRLPLINARKELGHSGETIEGSNRDIGNRYCIIDDFISTGNTVTKIRNMVSIRAPSFVCVGIYLYNCYAEGRESWYFQDGLTVPVLDRERL